MRSQIGFLILCAAVLGGTAPARADTVIEPQGDYELNTNVVIDGTIGETIKVPTNGDTSLVSFAIGIVNDELSPSSSNLLAEVYAWDGSKATGLALYTSPLTPIATYLTDPTYAPFPIFETGGINLTAGAEYVIFLDVLPTNPADLGVYYVDELQSGAGYADGTSVRILSDDPSVWTTEDWQEFEPTNFIATFGAPVPEPATWILLTAGFAGLAAGSRLRSKFRAG
jgi:hypothetical protein